MLVKDEGVCLARREYSETSQLATVFTCRSGKIRGIAKGARRTKSKFGGGIELLSRGQIVFSPGRGSSTLVTLTEWTVQEIHRPLRSNLQQLHRAYYLVELVDLFTEELDPHPQLYEYLCRALADLSAGPRWNGFLGFQVRLLREVGLSPALSECVRCGQRCAGQAGGYLSSTEGGILCGPCSRQVPEKWPIEPAGLAIVRSMAADSLSEQAKDSQADGQADLKERPARQAQKLLGYWIRSALNREPRTACLLR